MLSKIHRQNIYTTEKYGFRESASGLKARGVAELHLTDVGLDSKVKPELKRYSFFCFSPSPNRFVDPLFIAEK